LLFIPDIFVTAKNIPLSLHNRKLSLHILCITAQYFMLCPCGYFNMRANIGGNVYHILAKNLKKIN